MGFCLNPSRPAAKMGEAAGRGNVAGLWRGAFDGFYDSPDATIGTTETETL